MGLPVRALPFSGVAIVVREGFITGLLLYIVASS